MGLFNFLEKDESGLKSVTVYWKGRPFRHVHTSKMKEADFAKLVDRISDRNLSQRIKMYMKKKEVIEKGNYPLPEFTSQSQFEDYVRKEFSPRAEAAVMNTSLIDYLIVAIPN